MNLQIVRSNDDLESYLYDIWEDSFADIPRKNLVLIFFGRYSKRRLGSIRWATKRSRIKGLLKEKEEIHKAQDDPRVSIITLTKYFAHEIVPESVVRMTIAHEMVHYAHGFHSPLPNLYKHPHRGNIVNRELVKRGLEIELNEAERWLDGEWHQTIKILNKHRR